MGKKTQNQQKNKRQNRPSEIRLAGVPPIMAIKTQNQKKNKGQNRHSEIRLSGVLPIIPLKIENQKKKETQNQRFITRHLIVDNSSRMIKLEILICLIYHFPSPHFVFHTSY